ncbi:hypothetical protein Ddc_18021 [Ditylenchus destructor]|nr:hypothetical protein Ddc_18021 [Ditylenchus destructor]
MGGIQVDNLGRQSLPNSWTMSFKVFLKNRSDRKIDQPEFVNLEGLKSDSTIRQLASELEEIVEQLAGNDKLPFWKAYVSNANGFPGGINLNDPSHAKEFASRHFPGKHGMYVVIQRFEYDASIVGIHKDIRKPGITYSGL